MARLSTLLAILLTLSPAAVFAGETTVRFRVTGLFQPGGGVFDADKPLRCRRRLRAHRDDLRLRLRVTAAKMPDS